MCKIRPKQANKTKERPQRGKIHINTIDILKDQDIKKQGRNA